MGQDDITLTSSTDSEVEVQAALTDKTVEQVEAEIKAAAAAAPPAEPETKVAPPAAKPDGKTEETPEAKAEPTPDPNETPEQKAERERKASSVDKRVNKIQARIDEVWAKKKEAERATEEAERRRVAAEKAAEEAERKAAEAAAKATPPATPPAEAAAKPKLDDKDAQGNPLYATYEDWTDALGKWHGDRAKAEASRESAERIAALEKAERERIDRESALRGRQEVLAQYASRIEEFKTTAPDYDAVIEGATDVVEELQRELGPSALDVIEQFTTADAINGPAVQYHLAQHTDDLERIAKLAPAHQLIELARLDARLEAAKTPARPPVAAPVTTAPEPIKPVGSSPTTSGVSPEDEPYRDYALRRNREERMRAGLPV